MLDCDNDDYQLSKKLPRSYTKMQNLAKLTNWPKVMMVTVSAIFHTLKQHL